MEASDLGLPTDYEAIFEDRLLVITGAARSGTSIAGKVVGSLEPVFYYFEPVLFSYLPPLAKQASGDADRLQALLRGLLFEDYFLQQIHGRNLNFKSGDLSYAGHYWTEEEIEDRWAQFDRRTEVLDYLEEEDPLFAVKIPQSQASLDVLRSAFPRASFLHIVRDGNDVVQSALSRGWYTDEHVSSLVQWTRTPEDAETPVPWYVPDELAADFAGWTPTTRAAAVWRIMVEAGRGFANDHPGSTVDVRYEAFLDSPLDLVRQMEDRFGVARTELTEEHLASVEAHETSDYPPVSPKIEDRAERERFEQLRADLGYGDGG